MSPADRRNQAIKYTLHEFLKFDEDSDPRKKFKGRAVLDGSWVKDENYDVALFNEIGSSPANMQAGKKQ